MFYHNTVNEGKLGNAENGELYYSTANESEGNGEVYYSTINESEENKKNAST